VNWLTKRRAALTATVLAALTLSACGGGGDSGGSSGSAQKFNDKEQTDITVWSGYTGRELGIFDEAVKGFEKEHPNVHVDSVGAINDDKIIAAIRGGNAADVTVSFSTDNTGAYCSSGGWIDLAPYIERDSVDVGAYPQAVQYYTQYNGERCAMPMPADAYGLYYNKDMFAAAGIKGPPKTYSELDADAKKLTQRNSDGSLSVVGFNPTMGFYEHVPAHYAPPWDAHWVNSDGKSNLAGDPQWAKMLEWDKSLIGWYGYDDLQRWQAGAGAEFSASNAFETGKMAMMMDGEYRTAFIADEAPALNYGTAPMPVADNKAGNYGAGYLTGTIVGIPKGGDNEAASWELVKYLTTDPHAIALVANGLANIPTTEAARNDPAFEPSPQLEEFLRIFTSPHSQTSPITAAGAAYQNLFQSFISKWQAGEVSDLHAGLVDTDKQIDAQEELASGGGPGGNVP
jgi:multiple sugar transport system substrate-binding protein